MFLRPYPPGSREDYLMMVVMYHAATPEELQEWQKLARPIVLERWEHVKKHETERVQRRIDHLREQALEYRRRKWNDDLQRSLELANRFEQYADFYEQMLAQGIFPSNMYISYSGLVGDK